MQGKSRIRANKGPSAKLTQTQQCRESSKDLVQVLNDLKCVSKRLHFSSETGHLNNRVCHGFCVCWRSWRAEFDATELSVYSLICYRTKRFHIFCLESHYVNHDKTPHFRNYSIILAVFTEVEKCFNPTTRICEVLISKYSAFLSLCPNQLKSVHWVALGINVFIQQMTLFS